MFGNYFYFASMRKVTAVFGSLFSNITIQRTDIDGDTKIIPVPIAMGARRSFLVKLNEEVQRNPDNAPNVGITLPRMSWDMVGLTYNAERKVSSFGYSRTTDEGAGIHKQFNPVPYNYAYELNVAALNIDDVQQIAEQIIPFFTPDLSVTINEIPDIGVKNDVTFILEGVDTTVDYEGIIGDDRLVNWQFQFTAKSQLYPPVSDVGLIKKVIANIEANDNDKLDQRITVEVDPQDADFEDSWTVKKTIEEF